MAQRAIADLMAETPVHRNELVEGGLDEPALILIRHCRDMKRQEACLRLITLLLLFSCTALFVFTNGVELRQQKEVRSNDKMVFYQTFFFCTKPLKLGQI